MFCDNWGASCGTSGFRRSFMEALQDREGMAYIFFSGTCSWRLLQTSRLASVLHSVHITYSQ